MCVLSKYKETLNGWLVGSAKQRKPLEMRLMSMKLFDVLLEIKPYDVDKIFGSWTC